MSEDYTAFEKTWLRGSFEVHCLSSSFAGNTKRFETLTARIVSTVNECDYDLLGREQKLPRLLGLRDRSRYWTAFMVVEHLRLHVEFIYRAMQALLIDNEARAIVPEYRYLIPDDVGADCIDAFQDSVWQYVGFANNLAESGQFREPTGAIEHPLFGRLNLKRLHALASFHCRIHRPQIQKIIAIEGVV